MSRYNKYIKANLTSISSDYTDLHSNYITSILDTDHTLLTTQQTSRRERNTSLAIERNTSTKRSAFTN